MPDFSHSCRAINYLPNGTILEAECRDDDNEWIPTDIRLSDHIGNLNGHLAFDLENFGETCHNCHLEFMDNNVNVFLVCDCETFNQNELLHTQTLLDRRISNIDGQLEYDEPIVHDPV